MEIISVWNPKGGNGKTTLILNLAAAFANKGLKVAVVDLDKQQSAYNISKSGELMFEVYPDLPPNPVDVNILLLDYPAQAVSLRVSRGVVVVPILPSRIDYIACMSVVVDIYLPITYVMNRVDSRINSQRKIVGHMATKNKAIIIKQRSIYTRTLDEHRTVFDNKFTKTYGTREARLAMNCVMERVLKQLSEVAKNEY